MRSTFLQSTKVKLDDLEIVVTYDNYSYRSGLLTGWGFSCLIRGTDKVILFDTGGAGEILLFNLRRLNIDPQEVDLIVLSHIHADHIGGLPRFLQENADVVIYVPASFPKTLKNKLKDRALEVIEVHYPLQISPGVYSAGESGSWPQEQSLLIDTDQGAIVITGCAHPGIVGVLQRAVGLVGAPLRLALGGFHLSGKSQNELNEIIKSFVKMGVLQVGACHCSGDRARRMLDAVYREQSLEVGVGSVISSNSLQLLGGTSPSPPGPAHIWES